MKKEYISPEAQIEVLRIDDTINVGKSTLEFDPDNKDYYERIPA